MISRPGAAWVVATVVALLGLGGAPPGFGQEQSPGARPPTMAPPEVPFIMVVGSGTAAARPDTAEVSAGVVTQASSAGQALTQNSVAMDKVLKAVKALNIADRDVRTATVNVVPMRRQGRQEPQPPEIVGYEVSNQVRIKVRDLTTLGLLLDALVGQGANVVGGISFSVADSAPVLDQARALAMADARRRADVYAQAAGVKLGPVLSIREAAPGIPRFGAEMPRTMALSAVPVAPGEQEFQASVTVTYAIR
jgi:uncharacterized protein YggE